MIKNIFLVAFFGWFAMSAWGNVVQIELSREEVGNNESVQFLSIAGNGISQVAPGVIVFLGSSCTVSITQGNSNYPELPELYSINGTSWDGSPRGLTETSPPMSVNVQPSVSVPTGFLGKFIIAPANTQVFPTTHISVFLGDDGNGYRYGSVDLTVGVTGSAQISGNTAIVNTSGQSYGFIAYIQTGGGSANLDRPDITESGGPKFVNGISDLSGSSNTTILKTVVTAHNTSTSYSYTLTPDSAPVITGVPGYPLLWNGSSQNVSFSVSSASGIPISYVNVSGAAAFVNGSPWQKSSVFSGTGAGPFTFAVPNNGTYTITATDALNMAASPKTVSVLDTSSPTLSVGTSDGTSSLAAQGSNTNPQSLGVHKATNLSVSATDQSGDTGVDLSTLKYSLQQYGNTVISNQVITSPISMSSSGVSTLNFSVMDFANNPTTLGPVAITILAGPPTISVTPDSESSIVVTPDGQTWYTTRTFLVSATDAIGRTNGTNPTLVTVQYSLDNGVSWAPITGGLLNFTADGNYSVRFKATDEVGNAATVAKTIDIHTTPPSVTDQTATNYANANSLQWAASITDTGITLDTPKAFLYYDPNGTGLPQDDTTISISHNGSVYTFTPVGALAGDGNYYLKISCQDAAKLSSFLQLKNIYLDTTPPVIAFTLGNSLSDPPVGGWTNNPQVPITISAQDSGSGSASVKISITKDSSTISSTNYSYPSDVPTTVSLGGLPAGDYQINVTATDTAGNTSSASQITVHYVPSLSWTPSTSPSITWNSDTNFTLNWTAPNTGNDTVTYSETSNLQGVTFPTSSNSLTSATGTVETVGSNVPMEITITASDLAGNTASATLSTYTRAILGNISQVQYSNVTSSQTKYPNKISFYYSGGNAGDILKALPTDGISELISSSPLVPNSVNIISGLTSHGSYQFQLIGYNSANPPVETESDFTTPFLSQYPNNRPLSFTISSTPPQGGSLWLGPKNALKWNAAVDPDGDSLSYTINLGTAAGSLSPVQTGLSSTMWAPNGLVDGTIYYATVGAIDPYGGSSTSSNTVAFQYDDQSPLLSWTWSAAAYLNGRNTDGSAVLIGITASDSLSGSASMTGSLVENADASGNPMTSNSKDVSNYIVHNGDGTWSLGYWPTSSGNYTLTVTAADNANNTAQITKTFYFDATPPAINYVSFSGSLIKVATRAVPISAGTVSDDFSGVSKLEYQWGNSTVTGSWTSFGGTGLSVSLSGLSLPVNVPDGTYNLNLRATDTAGNVTLIRVPVSFIIDLSSLTTTLSVTGGVSSDTGTVVSDLSNLTVSATSSDPVSTVVKTEFAVSRVGTAVTAWNADWAGARTTASASLVAGTWYQVWVRVTNGVGGTLITSSSRFLYDNTSPVSVSLTASQSQAYAGDIVRFTGAGAEPQSGIARFELTLGTASAPTSVSSLMTGSVNGILAAQGVTTPVWQAQIPASVVPGSYVATLTVWGWNGRSTRSTANLAIVAGTDPIAIQDDGPYASDLKAWFQATTPSPVDHFQIQVIDVTDNSSVLIPWMSLLQGQVSFDAQTDLSSTQAASIVNGKQYQIQVQAVSSSGAQGPVATSPGVVIDTTSPQITSVQTVSLNPLGQGTYYMDGDTINLSWTVAPSQFSPLQSLSLIVTDGSHSHHYSLPPILIQNGNSPYTISGIGSTLSPANGDRLGLTLEAASQAGVVTDQVLPAVFVCTTPPAIPVVVAGGAYNNLSQPMQAQWDQSAQSASIPTAYSWGVTQTPENLSSITSWTADTGNHVATYQASGTDGQIWYFVVQALSATGLTSYGVSSGITIDTTKPNVASVILANTAAPSGPEPVYINSLGGLNLVVNAWSQISEVASSSARFGTGISGSFIQKGTIGQSTTGTFADVGDNVGGVLADDSQIPNYPNVELPAPLVFQGTATNQAQNTSLPGYSAGVLFDTSRPTVSTVRISMSGSQLNVDWDPDLSHSSVPIAQYTIQIYQGSTLKVTQTTKNRSTVFNLADPGNALPDGRYSVQVAATNAAGTASLAAAKNFWIDHTPPTISRSSVPLYASTSIGISATVTAPPSGIVQWKYQVGPPQSPGLLTGGWINLSSNATALTPADATVALNGAAFVPDGTILVAQVQVESGAGLWSPVVTTNTSLVDLTPPVISGVTAPAYINTANQVYPVTFTVSDPQSGVAAYRLGLKDSTGTLVGNYWSVVAGLAGTPAQVVTVTNATLSFPAQTPPLVNGQTYTLVVQAQNNASTSWTNDAAASGTTIIALNPPVVGFSNPRSDGRVETVRIGNQSFNEFVVNSLPLSLGVTVNADVCPTVEAGIQVIDPEETETDIQVNLSGFPQTQTVSVPLIGNTYGIYTVIVTASDLAGNITIRSQRVRLNSPPQIILNPVVTTSGQPNTLSASILDPDTSMYGDFVANYSWTFGDGTPISTSANPIHIYHQNSTTAVPGSYQLTLSLTDNWGATAMANATVTVVNTLNGTLYENETWHGLQTVEGLVTVPQGVALTLTPSAQVQFSGLTQGFVVNGTLAVQDGATLGLAPSSSVSAWGTIYINGTASIGGADVSGATRAVAVAPGANVTLSGTNLHNNQIGLHLLGGSVSLNGGTLSGNSEYGIKEDGRGNYSVKNMVFTANGVNYYQLGKTGISTLELNSIPGNGGNQ